MKSNRRSINVPVITKAMQIAGIIRVTGEQQTNGAWPCRLDLKKVAKDKAINPRDLDQSHVQDLMDNFVIECINAPKVALEKKGDKLALFHIDGQHTIKLLRDKDITEATCQVWFFPDTKTRALIYSECNSNTKKTPTWKAHELWTKGEKEVNVIIQKAIDAHGFTTPLSPKKKQDGYSLKSFNVLRSICCRRSQKNGQEAGGENALNLLLDGLAALKRYCQKHNGEELFKYAASIEFCRGLYDAMFGRLIAQDLSQQDIVKLLEDVSPKMIQQYAKDFSGDTSRPTRGNYRDAIELAIQKTIIAKTRNALRPAA